MDLKGNSVTWVSHGTWLWETSEGKRILVDAWLGGCPTTPEDLKDPGHLDALLITHGHGDHIGDAVATINEKKPAVFGTYEIGNWLGSKGCENVTGFNIGGTAEAAGVRITTVAANHSSSIDDPEYTGGDDIATGFLMEFPDGLRVYQAGDTDVFGDMALIRELFEPHVAVLPIGDFFTMGPARAAKAVDLLGVKQVLCGHFGTFPPLVGRPSELRSLVSRDVEVPDLEPGSRF